MEIDERVLRILFDTAISSMDSGSGFLDAGEVAALRQAAAVLGVDPEAATPASFICAYRGHHQVEPCLDRYMLTSPDGLQLNAFRLVTEFPEHVRPFLKRIPAGDLLGELDCPVLAVRCTVCFRHWDVFADTSVREPAS